jgi:hypothetical protein
MRLRNVLVLFTLTLGLCSPVPHPIEDNEIQPPQSSVLPGVKAGFIISFSLAGLFALAVGVTEYASRLHNRFKKNQIENQNLLQEINFNRSQKLTENDFRYAGTDVVLDLVEKYVTGNNEKENEMEANDHVSNKTVLLAEEKTAVETASTNGTEELRLPRLPGFPPLSERVAR